MIMNKSQQECTNEIYKKLSSIADTPIFRRHYRYYLSSIGVQNPTAHADSGDIYSFAVYLSEKPEQFTKLIQKYEKQ